MWLGGQRGGCLFYVEIKLEQTYYLVGTIKSMKNFSIDWRMFTWKFQKVIGNYSESAKHMDDTDRSFLEELLPWSPKLPDNCRKNKQEQPN